LKHFLKKTQKTFKKKKEGVKPTPAASLRHTLLFIVTGL
jgi:hypothetical protein